MRNPLASGTPTAAPPPNVGSGAPLGFSRASSSWDVGFAVSRPLEDCASVTSVPPGPIATLKPLAEVAVGIVATPPEPKPWSTAPAGVSRVIDQRRCEGVIVIGLAVGVPYSPVRPR